ncbi:DUF3298 domain-containing protein [Acinetobacter chinensis]|uniref:DUF3298 domain-containing protein n=1 Tax=Acinetobacter chinensis TaxID=2004650 RepID=A0A3B7M0D6_9GAMM|nr:RsiV family protein [Acinetobacter chinensis]AXY56043.1 DUF3298 domain-containing protein [Acinetobacter chinensis]
MTQKKYKKWMVAVPVVASVMIFSGCQEKPAVEQKAAVEATGVPLIQSKIIPVKLAKSEICDNQGCTRYDLQTVETNVSWINDYFMDRLKKADPVVFNQDAAVQNPAEEKDKTDEQGLSSSSADIRYIGQHYNIATFALSTYNYSAGAAHGMYHVEYVNFDLISQQRLALQDILVKGAEQKIRDAIYESNTMWLSEHNIEKSKLQLSDNYYYGVNGLVFVYPLYELASYAEGMSELTLPYHIVKKLIKPEYLPELPQYAAS